MEPNEKTEEQKSESRKRSRLLLCAAAAVLVLVIVIIVLAVSGSSGNESAASAAEASALSAEAAAAGTGNAASGSAGSSAGNPNTAPVNAGTVTTADTGTAAETIAAGSENTEYHVGDMLMDGDVKVVYVASGDYTEANDTLQPETGCKYICLKFAFENRSVQSDAVISMYNFECFADGEAAEQYYGGTAALNATLSTGRAAVGYVYYQVPEAAQTITVTYTTLSADQKLTFVYDGNQDSGYTPDADTASSAGAYAAGSAAEAGDLTITLAACENDTADAQLTPPADGTHYITCTFDLTNHGDSNAFVSYDDFACYADGVNCEVLYTSDDALVAKVPGGQNASGTITYEVPDNASVIELEFLKNTEQGQRIVFSATADGSSAPAASVVSFDDVAADSYCYDAVCWAASSGIASGTSDTTFSPEEPCTRGQVVIFLWHLAGEPQARSSENSFTDLTADPGSDLYDAVMWAVEEGITSGTSDTTFSPDDNVTRGQVVTFLWRFAGKPIPVSGTAFADTASDNPFYDAIMWAVGEGITSGTSDTTFSPDDQCTRGQVVTFLYRFAG